MNLLDQYQANVNADPRDINSWIKLVELKKAMATATDK